MHQESATSQANRLRIIVLWCLLQARAKNTNSPSYCALYYATCLRRWYPPVSCCVYGAAPNSVSSLFTTSSREPFSSETCIFADVLRNLAHILNFQSSEAQVGVILHSKSPPYLHRAYIFATAITKCNQRAGRTRQFVCRYLSYASVRTSKNSIFTHD